MASTFKNYTSASVGTSAVTVYTVPASTTTVVIGCNLANRTGSSVNVDVQLGSTYVVKGAPVPSGSALGAVDGKIIAEAGETVVVTSDTASSVDVILSVLEQS
jgi:hypothetical protein